MKGILQSERYIIDESSEISFGELPWAEKFFRGFPAFRHRNYRLYFTGQLISLIGTWLQMVAQGWLVLQLTHSAFWVGTIAALGALPILIFTLFGGVIIDRFPKKNILLFTQAASMILAVILGVLALSGAATVGVIGALAFLLGTVNALDLPARQSFVVEMVGKADLTSAIALNSATFNGARVIGPGIAGLIIAWIGVGGAFIIDGISYLAVLVALLLITTEVRLPRTHPHPIRALKEGIFYSFSHPVIRDLLLFAGITSIFGWSYGTIMPVIAERSFHLDASGLGFLYAASGIGALIGTVLLSMFAKKISSSLFIFGGIYLFVASIIAFSFTSHVLLAMLFLLFASMGIILQFATINSVIQHTVPDVLRGRVLSIYTVMFLGVLPFGSFLMGVFSEHFGTSFAIRLGAMIVFLFSPYFLFNLKTIKSSFSATST